MHTADSAAVHRVAEYLKMPADYVLLDFCVGGEAIIPIKDIKKTNEDYFHFRSFTSSGLFVVNIRKNLTLLLNFPPFSLLMG